MQARRPGLRAEVRAGLKQPGPAPAEEAVAWSGPQAMQAGPGKCLGCLTIPLSGSGGLGRRYLRPGAAWTTRKSAWAWPETTGRRSPWSEPPGLPNTVEPL